MAVQVCIEAGAYTDGHAARRPTYVIHHPAAAGRGDVVTADITTLLAAAEHGDRAAGDAVFTALYEELHRMARRELSRRGGGVTLGATTLLHDAYLNISGRDGTAFPDRNRFMGYASRVMRGIIIDYARSRQAQKRGGQFEITSLKTDVAEIVADAEELSRISDALDELSTIDERLQRIVDLKFFCGFSFVEIAGMMNLSERTVQRDWEKARIFLHQRLQATVDHESIR
ncbi:MAG TPA: ECF-type sigma factor [Vicinamibacterales bacterium]